MKVIINIFIFFILFNFVGCAQLQSISQTAIPADRSKKISAEVKRHIILFFNFSTGYVDEVQSDLRNKCQAGKISGITTKHYTVTYFPGIYYQDRIEAYGYCHAN